MTTMDSTKTHKTPTGMTVKTVHIKEPELMTNTCNEYMWAKFKKNKNKHCSFTRGYWDITFDTDDKYKQLREHLDAILSSLQRMDIQMHFGINTGDGGFLCKDEMKCQDDVLHITIDEEYKYELIWYNARPLTTTQAIYIKQTVHQINNKEKPFKTLKMYIMYFPKPDKQTHWLWYHNNECQYRKYENQNDMLQLECSYLSNLEENYPRHVIHQYTQSTVGYFSHCIFETFMRNQNIWPGRHKLYVLRYTVIEEIHNEVVIEQVAYTNDSDFSRSVRRITEYETENPMTPRMNRTTSVNIKFPLKTPSKNTFNDVIDSFSKIFIQYQEWLSNSNKKHGILPKLEEMYNLQKKPQQTLVKLRDDFAMFSQEMRKKDDPSNEVIKTLDDINSTINVQFGHKSEDCICVKRVHRDRNKKATYFGFVEKQEIIAQQLLDSYHCVFLHLYDIKANDKYVDDNKYEEYEEYDDEKQHSLPRSQSSNGHNRISSLNIYTECNKNKKKFNTYGAYERGYRFHYPDNKQMAYHWFVKPSAANLKDEMLAFGDNFGCSIGINQFEEEYEKASIHVLSEEVKLLRSEESKEDKLQINITHDHLLAIQFYCSYTEAVKKFAATFQKARSSETDEELKERHSKCAFWGKYLRECVDKFGLILRENNIGEGISFAYYRGITKQFLFKKLILQFNAPLSTTVSRRIANDCISDHDGLVLTLKPHWAECKSNVWRCTNYSDYPYEQEYLFMGDVQPLVIHNIREVASGGETYLHKLQAMSNIRQIFEGMACDGTVRPEFIKQLIDNRLKGKDDVKEDDNYMSNVFDFYCDNMRELTIRLFFMDKIDTKIKEAFMNEANTLKLTKIIKLFPYCKKITLYDGYHYHDDGSNDKDIDIKQTEDDITWNDDDKDSDDDMKQPQNRNIGGNYKLIPQNAEYKDTILGETEKCLEYVKGQKHPLKLILLEVNEQIQEELWKDYQPRLNKLDWKCETNKNNNAGYSYAISRLSST